MIPGYLKSVWQYRNFILASIMSELKGRFANSKIGGLWYVLHPLAMASIYALVLSRVLDAKMDGVQLEGAYAIYLIAGIAGWGFFQEISNRCLTVFIEYGNKMKKISFPKVSLPIIIFGVALINHIILLLTCMGVFLLFGHFPSFLWLLLPVAILGSAIFSFGLGLFLGILNVFARDVGQVMAVVFNLWFWLTPIVYPLNILPDHLKVYMQLNPMFSVIQSYQSILLYNRLPDFVSLIYPYLFGLILLGATMFIFRKAGEELVDVL